MFTYVLTPTKNTLAVKKSCGQDLRKGCDEKNVKSKGGSQGLCRNAVDHIKNFDNDDHQVPQCRVFLVGISLLSLEINACSYKHISTYIYPLTLHECFFVHTIYIVLKINRIDNKINVAVNCR